MQTEKNYKLVKIKYTAFKFSLKIEREIKVTVY